MYAVPESTQKKLDKEKFDKEIERDVKREEKRDHSGSTMTEGRGSGVDKCVDVIVATPICYILWCCGCCCGAGSCESYSDWYDRIMGNTCSVKAADDFLGEW